MRRGLWEAATPLQDPLDPPQQLLLAQKDFAVGSRVSSLSPYKKEFPAILTAERKKGKEDRGGGRGGGRRQTGGGAPWLAFLPVTQAREASVCTFCTEAQGVGPRSFVPRGPFFLESSERGPRAQQGGHSPRRRGSPLEPHPQQARQGSQDPGDWGLVWADPGARLGSPAPRGASLSSPYHGHGGIFPVVGYGGWGMGGRSQPRLRCQL